MCFVSFYHVICFYQVLLELGPDTAPPESENSYGESTVSSVHDEKPAAHQSHPANLNQSMQSDKSSQLNRSNLSDQMNQSRISHPHQRPDHFYHNHPMQGRPVSMDVKYVPGFHYVEHGPRAVSNGQGTRVFYHPIPMDPGVRNKMMNGPLNYYHHHHHHPVMRQPSQENGLIRQGERNRYVQQYLPT